MHESGRFAISSIEEARAAIEYFNAFHDGFIRRIVIDSQDRIEEDGSQRCSGLYDIQITLGHYNYPAGALQPFDREITATFRDAQDVHVDLAQAYLGSPIIQLAAEDCERIRGGTTSKEAALALKLGRHFYIESQRSFDYREQRLFTFTSAEIVER